MSATAFSRLILCLCIIGLFASCHTLVEDEFPDFAQTPVLNGLLQADSTFRVQVSLTANLTDSLPVVVNNARVIIETPGEAPDTLVYTEKGWYVSPRIVKAGAEYSCKVEIPGFPVIRAHTNVPEPTASGETIYTRMAYKDEEGSDISSVAFKIANDPAKNCFWEVRLISEGVTNDYDFDIGEWVEKFRVSEKEIFMIAGTDPVLLHEANPLTVFSNRQINAAEYVVKFYYNRNYTGFYEGQIPYVLLHSMDESCYKYIKQYYIYETAGWMSIGKSPQRYPLYSNIINGTGLFTAFSTTKIRLYPD